MRSRVTITVGVLVVIGVLVALSSLSYAPKERKPDAEFSADGSTYNSGASGTKALYDFFSEGGYQVIRWRDPISKLGKSESIKPKTLVLIGPLLIPLKQEESSMLLSWVEQGN